MKGSYIKSEIPELKKRRIACILCYEDARVPLSSSALSASSAEELEFSLIERRKRSNKLLLDLCELLSLIDVGVPYKNNQLDVNDMTQAGNENYKT